VSLLGRLVEKRAVSSVAGIPKNSDGYSADSGVHVSDRTALQLVAVYACVRLLADSVASLPLDVYRKSDNVRAEVSPTPRVIKQPNSDLTPFEWKFQTVTSLAMRGDSFDVITGRDRLEFATELLPVHPDIVEVEPDRNTGKPAYKVNGERVPSADMVHIRRFSLPGALTGLAPIEQARQGIGLGLAAERYGARWFGDSANPSSVLETEQDLTDAQVLRNQKSWVQSHGGRRHPAVMSGGLKWKQISITPNESQFLETRRFQRSEIAMLFGVPPHMIGDTEKSTSWGTGIEQQSIGFVTYTLRPWLTCIESALSKLLPRGQFVRFNVDALLRGDTKSRYEAYTQARNAGWLNVDEIRELEDRAPIPDGSGQSYVQPLNMGPLGSDPLKQEDPDEGQDETD
jgi:HK97 family phage portal protein